VVGAFAVIVVVLISIICLLVGSLLSHPRRSLPPWSVEKL
jgi:hypothetical protein